MSKKYFITGTDTNIGKTYVACQMLRAYAKDGYSTLGVKPIASGCTQELGSLKNADALALQAASTIQLPYHQINPYAFEPPIAPHLVQQVTVRNLIEKTQYALDYPADICLIEGVGGWYVPLNDKETMADYVKALNLPVVLVVGMRLGCLNHALLTYRAMVQDKVNVVGWVANGIDPKMECREENIETLKRWLPMPCLGLQNCKFTFPS